MSRVLENRLILIEGIPGSGKTTIAGKVKEYLEDKGIKTKLFSEGDAHPADMAWNAYLTIDEYEKIIKDNSKLERIIKEFSQFEEGYVIVAYTKLGLSPEENELMRYFEEHEVYDGKIDIDTFKKIHFKRWEKFAANMDKDSVVIFECSFLQNHINELMGFHLKDSEFISNYLLDLIKTVEKLNPKLVYLTQPYTYETIERVAKERISLDKSKWEDWIVRVIRYVKDSPYGKRFKLMGFEGAVKFFDDRKKIELDVIEKLPISKVIIQNAEYNWNDVFNKVTASL